MGSKWFTGGVAAAPHGRIQFDFMFEGDRYRPSMRHHGSHRARRAAQGPRRWPQHELLTCHGRQKVMYQAGSNLK